MNCCMRSRRNGDNIVKAVFYAIVVSLLASAYLSIAGNNIVSFASWSDFCAKIKHAVNCEKCLFVLVPLSYFLFFTGYFYDEWRSSSPITKGESILDLISWVFFTFQVLFMRILQLSFLCCVIGCLIETMILCRHKSANWMKGKGWLGQNIMWLIAALIALGGTFMKAYSKWVSFPLLFFAAIVIIVWKVLVWRKEASRTESEGLAPILLMNKECILLNRMMTACKHANTTTTKMPNVVIDSAQNLGISTSRRDELWEYCLALMQV